MRSQWTLLAAAATACASAGTSAATPRRMGDVITAEEVAASTATNAYDLVRLLRPQWLVVRGIAGTTDPGASGIQVYVDGIRRGGLGALESIGSEQVDEIQRLDAGDATLRYGTNHVHGAIEVRTRR